jgi:hypothetical protein
LPPDPDRQLIGSKGGHTSWANTRTEDRGKRTAPAGAALDAKFLAQADGDPVRAESFRKAYYADLAIQSVRGRRRKKARRKAHENLAAAEAAETELAALGGA